nr:retrovirus-related Pol polyprotein from transposon TNT 1-94 [Tanacetum cinerariifolium]
TEWLHYNEWNTDGRHLTYLDFPSEFVWYADGMYWQQRHVRTKSSIDFGLRMPPERLMSVLKDKLLMEEKIMIGLLNTLSFPDLPPHRLELKIGTHIMLLRNITTAEAGKELVWLKNFLEELDRAQTEYVLFCDNQNAIHLMKNPGFHSRTKHIKIRYHYIRELVSEGTLSLKKILRAKNLADMLTKVVTTEKLKLCAASTGLRDN